MLTMRLLTFLKIKSPSALVVIYDLLHLLSGPCELKQTFKLIFPFLQYLCECQFDENVKFKTAINEEDPEKMRLQPIGRDKDGQMYWFQLDQDDNVRVYVEEQDDLDGSSWKCIVK